MWTQHLQSPWALSEASPWLTFSVPPACFCPLVLPAGTLGSSPVLSALGGWGAHLGLPFLAGEDSVPFSTQATPSSLAQAGLSP